MAYSRYREHALQATAVRDDMSDWEELAMAYRLRDLPAAAGAALAVRDQIRRENFWTLHRGDLWTVWMVATALLMIVPCLLWIGWI